MSSPPCCVFVSNAADIVARTLRKLAMGMMVQRKGAVNSFLVGGVDQMSVSGRAGSVMLEGSGVWRRV